MTRTDAPTKPTPGAHAAIGTTDADVARIPQREQESDEHAAYRLLAQAKWLILCPPAPLSVDAARAALDAIDEVHWFLRGDMPRFRARCFGRAAGLLFRARELGEVAS